MNSSFVFETDNQEEGEMRNTGYFNSNIASIIKCVQPPT